jgi:DNA invertase Pin-like site-specific DNA recombinase
MSKHIALYLRVSTAKQTVENQRRELEAVAAHHGWQIIAEFRDEGVSGRKGRDTRPGFDRLCQGIARREFDRVAAWSVDHLGRSLQDLVAFLAELHAKDVDLYLHQQGIDTATSAGKALFQTTGVFAEFERANVVERDNAGPAQAKAEGRRRSRPTLPAANEDIVWRLPADGTDVVKATPVAPTGVSGVQRIKAAKAAPLAYIGVSAVQRIKAAKAAPLVCIGVSAVQRIPAAIATAA